MDKEGKAEKLTLEAVLSKMGPAQLVTVRVYDERKSEEPDVFRGRAVSLRHPGADNEEHRATGLGLLQREVKHITTVQDDADLRGLGAPEKQRDRRGIVVVVYDE